MLKKYIEENVDKNKEDKYYNESFCNLVLDYIGSFELTKEDVEFLKLNNYDVEDFEIVD